MCKQVIRLYPLCTPDQPEPPWHQTTDETAQCQDAVNNGGVLCEEFEEPEVLTIKNSRCPPCLLQDRQEHNAHAAWEEQAMKESEQLAAAHAQQMDQRNADLAREEEEQLQRILEESEQMALRSPPPQAFVDDEEELRKALEASMGTNEEDEQRRITGGGADDEQLRQAIEASMGTTQEDDQRRAARVGPKIFFVRHVKKMCCGKIIKERTDIEKDADSDGIPFLEEEDYMPCDECVGLMLAEQDAAQFGGSSTGADVPPLRTGRLPPGFEAPMSQDSPSTASQLDTEAIDLDPTGRGKSPRYPHTQPVTTLDTPVRHSSNFSQSFAPPETQTAGVDTHPLDSDPPGYVSHVDLSRPTIAISPAYSSPAAFPEDTHPESFVPDEEDEEMRRPREVNAQMNASRPEPAQASTSRANDLIAFSDNDYLVESRPASPRTVMANQASEDAAREHLAAARADLRQNQQQRTQQQVSSGAASRNAPAHDGDEEGEDSLGDLPGSVSRMHLSSGTPPRSSSFRRGGLRAPPRHGTRSDLLPGAPRGPEDHDWNHDWLNEEGNHSDRLPSFMSSVDVSRGTRPVPGQETE
ncbi:MAG: hypothetical protein Q9165_003932 [Trypethelium subeluteriae]